MTAPKTQQTSSAPLSDKTRTATGSSQWLLEHPDDAKTPVFHFNKLDVFVCGQQSFAAIAADIQAARRSIDIIAWGFDPAMELTRGNGGVWPRGGKTSADTSTTYGALLRAAAQRGVKVRLLVWYDPLLGKVLSNMPGYKYDASYELKAAPAQGMAAAVLPRGQTPPLAEPTDPADRRKMFNAHWYRDVVAGKVEGLSLRTRGTHRADIVAALSAEAGHFASPRTLLEKMSLEMAATHHQKTIVIDYDSTDAKAGPVGYVMGLNSVTDYWDTAEHTFNDPRRGQHYEGDDKDHSVGKGWERGSAGAATLKPYQDFVCRIEGEALAAVCKNFVQAWNTARQTDACAGSNDTRSIDLRNVPQHLTQHLSGSFQKAQIVRTLPGADGGSERAIERTYWQAASFARHYIYIENQYFQHTDWVRDLKAARKKFVQDLGAGGLPVTQIPALHVIAVVPTPERGQMVPRTHDVVTELGYGDSVPDQDKRIKQELANHARHEREMAEYQARKKSFEAKGMAYPIAPPYTEPLTDLAQAQLASGGDQASEAVRRTLANMLGMRTLVCSLWACNDNFVLANTPVARQADREQREHATALKDRARFDADRAKAQARNASLGGWENHTDTRPPLAPPPDRSQQLLRANAQRYREVYIHSKLMIIDDSFFTLGSANLNVRSFEVDSEINIASDNRAKATDLRRRVWAQHSKALPDMGGGDATDRHAMGEAFKKWEKEASDNLKRKTQGEPISCSLVKFFDERTSTVRFG